MRFSFYPAIFSLACLYASALHAAEAALSPENLNNEPAFISAEHLSGVPGEEIEAKGAVELRQGKQVIYADRVLFSPDSNELSADGAIRMEKNGIIIEGTDLKLNLNTSVGDISQPTFQFTDVNGRGSADSMHMADKQNYILHNVSYTTCPRENDDWLLRLRVLEIDRGRQIGVAHHARVEFQGASGYGAEKA